VALDGAVPNAKDYLEFDKELRRREEAFRALFNEKRAEQSKRLRARITDYLIQVLDVQKLHTEEFYAFVAADDINPVVVRRWHSYLLETTKQFHPVWAPWHEFARIPANELAAKAARVIPSFTNDSQKINPLVAAAFQEKKPGSMREVAEVYGKLLSDVDKKWNAATDKKSALNKDEEALKQILYADDSPSVVPAGAIVDLEWYFDEGTRVALGRLSREVDQWIVQSAGAPPHAVILEDRPEVKNPRVFKRGNPASLGEEVPRRVSGDFVRTGSQAVCERQRTARPGQRRREQGQPTHRPRDGEPHLATSFRRGAGGARRVISERAANRRRIPNCSTGSPANSWSTIGL
jgi:hypothetical protein